MNSSVFFALRSPTVAIKAKKLLAYHGILASVVKKPSKNGCGYGISVSAEAESEAIMLMKRSGIL